MKRDFAIAIAALLIGATIGNPLVWIPGDQLALSAVWGLLIGYSVGGWLYARHGDDLF